MKVLKPIGREYVLERLAEIETELKEIESRIERRPTTSSAAVHIADLVNLCRLRGKRRELIERLRTIEIDESFSDIGYWGMK